MQGSTPGGSLRGQATSETVGVGFEDGSTDGGGGGDNSEDNSELHCDWLAGALVQKSDYELRMRSKKKRRGSGKRTKKGGWLYTILKRVRTSEAYSNSFQIR